MIDCINNHDKNINEYMIRNRQAIDKYLTTNKELQEKYKILISNLFEDDQSSQSVLELALNTPQVASTEETTIKSSLTKEQTENIKIEFNT